MNNERDNFEQQLKRQPLRQIPSEWREEILAAARMAESSDRSARAVNPSWFAAFNERLASIFWPHPAAWAGLAAIWIFIFVLNFSTTDRAPAMAKRTTAPSPEVIAEVKQQRQMFAELVGVNDVREADRPKIFSPRPRSEHIDAVCV